MTIPALPALNRASPTFRSDLDSYFLTSLPATTGAINAAILEIDADVEAAAGSVISAAGEAAAALQSREGSEAARDLSFEYANTAGEFASTAVNSPATQATSNSFLTVGEGVKTLTIQENKAFGIGQFVVIAYTSAPENYMLGQIIDYDSSTGVVSVNVSLTSGSGEYSAWSMLVSAPANGFVKKTGDTLTGPLVLAGNPTLPLQAAPKQYVEAMLDDAKDYADVVGFSVGDIKTTTSAPNSDWLPCDNASYLQSAYPALYSKIGLLPTDAPLATFTGVTQAAQSNSDIIFGGGVFLAFRGGGTAQRSTDNGQTFTPVTLPSAEGYYSGGAYMDGKFVVYTNNALAISTDLGATWTSATAPGVSQGQPAFMFAGQGVFVFVIRTYTTNTNVIYTSQDGSAWTLRHSYTGLQARGGGAGNGVFVVGDGMSGVASEDLVTWKSFTLGASFSSYGAGFALGYFWAVGYSSTGAVQAVMRVRNPLKYAAEILDCSHGVVANLATGGSPGCIAGNDSVVVIATTGDSSSASSVVFSSDGENFFTATGTGVTNNAITPRGVAVSDSAILLAGGLNSTSSIRRSIYKQYNTATEFVVPSIDSGKLKTYIKAR